MCANVTMRYAARVRRSIILISVAWASSGLASCARGEPAKTSVPPVDPVVVPAPTLQTSESSPELPPRVDHAQGPHEDAPESGARASFEVRVDSDGGNVVVRSTPDSGVQVWGTFQRKDGGFSFSGGFSTRSVDASAP